MGDSTGRPPIICRDPDVGGTTQNKDRKFALLGNENAEGTGLGNFLVFFPCKCFVTVVPTKNVIIS